MLLTTYYYYYYYYKPRAYNHDFTVLEFLLSFLVGKVYHRCFCNNSMDFKTIENMIWFSDILEREA